MRVKEYEQHLIEGLAKLHENIVKKAEDTEKYNIQIIRGMEHTLNKVIQKLMGFEFDSIRIGKGTYTFRYLKGEKVRHIRNMFKRR